MALRDIRNILLDKYTGLPSKDTFLKERVSPANVNDKFYNDKCAQCWDEYTEEHPAAKVLPCDLCPYCRTKLFRRDLTPEMVVEALVLLLVNAIMTHQMYVRQLIKAMNRSLQASPRWLKYFLCYTIGAPGFWVDVFVRRSTNILSRNPRLHLSDAFTGLHLGLQFLSLGLIYAPLLAIIYLIFDSASLRYFFWLLDFAYTMKHQLFSWKDWLNSRLDDPVDRASIMCLAGLTILIKQIMVTSIFWPAFVTPLLVLAWNGLATVAWR
ncbi:hypothetical protein SLS59_005432 [Nothophoma quercina]|uniref:Uncharacterized protein n=1 Tax=Nothophoma quercina TaxID=749835 RepID=A0ABR3RAI7_9PLEO